MDFLFQQKFNKYLFNKQSKKKLKRIAILLINVNGIKLHLRK